MEVIGPPGPIHSKTCSVRLREESEMRAREAASVREFERELDRRFYPLTAIGRLEASLEPFFCDAAEQTGSWEELFERDEYFD